MTSTENFVKKMSMKTDGLSSRFNINKMRKYSLFVVLLFCCIFHGYAGGLSSFVERTPFGHRLYYDGTATGTVRFIYSENNRFVPILLTYNLPVFCLSRCCILPPIQGTIHVDSFL